MNLKKNKIEKIIRECDKHLLRIQDASSQMDDFMPLDSQKYQNLSKLEVQIIDQFLFRFSKLQDCIGEKLFKAILSILEENIENIAYIDVLNRLEKLEILSSVDQWRELRNIRNELSHHYDDEAEDMAISINKIYFKKDALVQIYLKIQQYSNKL